MANNVYIGNRYVPVFADPVEWSSLRTYEALTIVTYLGTSYTSRKAVPAGIQLSNTEYWVVTGNYNGYINELQNQINDMNDGTVSGSLQNQINDMNDGTVSGSLQNQIDTINDEINPTKRYLFVSDSYGIIQNGVTPYTSLLQTKLNLTSDNFISLAEGSMGYARKGSGNHTVLELLQASTVANPNTITDVYLTAGLNDYQQSQSDIDSGIAGVVSYVKTTFPNAKMHFCFIGNSYLMSYADFKLAYNIVYAKVHSLGEDWCDNIQYVMHNFKYIQTDKIHPNAYGSEALADAFYSYIKNGTYSFYVTNSTEITPIGATAVNIKEEINNNISRMTVSLLRSTSTFSMDGTMKKFADISDGMINYKLATIQNGCGTCIIDGDNVPIPLTLTIKDNELFISTPGPNFTTNAFIVRAATYISSTIDG